MIPDFQSLMRPLLEALRNGGVRRTRDLAEVMSNRFDVTAEERAALLPSGRQRRIDNRVAWAISHLFQAGLLERPVARSPSPRWAVTSSQLIRSAST